MKSFEAIAQAAYQVFRANLPGGDSSLLVSCPVSFWH